MLLIIANFFEGNMTACLRISLEMLDLLSLEGNLMEERGED